MKIKIYFVLYIVGRTRMPPSQRKETLHISLHYIFLYKQNSLIIYTNTVLRIVLVSIVQ